MNFKKSITIVLIMVLSVGMIFYISSNNYKDKSFTEEELELMSIANDSISNMFNSQEFKNYTLADKIETTDSLLRAMKSLNLIKHLNFDENNTMFSFQYSSGVTGVVMIEDLDTRLIISN